MPAPSGPAVPAGRVPAVLTVTCPDRRGIVAAVAGCLAGAGATIVDSQQFGDPTTGRFFMRVAVADEAVAAPAGGGEAAGDGWAPVRAAFAGPDGPAERFAMDWQLAPADTDRPVVVLVSTQGHCLNDLLYRQEVGALPGRIAAVVGNHRDCEPIAARHGVPFTHVPTTGDRAADEARLVRVVEEAGAELVVLARYMQILSPQLCRAWAGRAINIHHSFLPSFTGARPYSQAFVRGVKVIGATAHYVTAELDQGPIIEQEVARVDHAMTPARLAAVGRDLESQALSRAVTWHLDHRVLLNGSRTVVFR